MTMAIAIVGVSLGVGKVSEMLLALLFGLAMIRSLRPDRLLVDRGSDHYRGGQVWAINGATSTIRLQAEASYVRDISVSTSLIPAGAQSVGCPVYCKVTTAGGINAYVITEITGSAFPGGVAPRDNAAAVARGEFYPGVVPREVT